MSQQFRALSELLRHELDAVHQQFIHILTLRAWNDVDTANRIAAVDNTDFRNAMRIIDFLVERKALFDLAGIDVSPGCTRRQMLDAELAMEQRLASAIGHGSGSVYGRAAELLAAAEEPRKAYRRWLREETATSTPVQASRAERCPEVGDLTGCLLVAIEQSMIHAFIHRSAGHAALADAAWASSGAAMMHVTNLIQICSARSTVSVPGPIPPPEIARDSKGALDADRRLAQRCAEHAIRAESAETSRDLEVLCREIKLYSLELSRWMPGSVHPAAGSNPPSFSCFENTVRKFVQAQDTDQGR